MPAPEDPRHTLRDNVIDLYCILQLLALLVLLLTDPLGPILNSVVAGYILFEIYLNLLNIVFIGKLRAINAPPASIERSILLLTVNVFDVVLAFGVLYREWLGLSRVEGLFAAVLVLGTIGHPPVSGRLAFLVALQVFLNLILVILVISSFVGQLGLFSRNARGERFAVANAADPGAARTGAREVRTNEQLGEDASPSQADLTKLQIAQSVRDYHHKALWEEEKHFMWFVSVVMSANILLATTDKMSAAPQGWLLLLVSLIGVTICLTALRVLRNESVNFQIAAYRFIRQHNLCFRDPQLTQVDPAAANKDWLSLVADGLRGRATIRDAFQLLFGVFLMLFLLVAVVGGVRAIK